MKSYFKRFLGLLLAMLMIVTMIPLTAFAEDVIEDDVAADEEVSEIPAGASFVVDGEKFILMDSTKVVDGKTYYGVLSDKYVTRGWGHARIKIQSEDITPDEDTEVVVSIVDDREGNPYDELLQEYTNFDVLGDYIIPADTEWVMYSGTPANTGMPARIYFKGSIGLPTSADLVAVKEKDSLAIGDNDDNYSTREIGFYQSYYYSSYLLKATDASGNKTGNTGMGDNPLNTMFLKGGTVYLMTYVSEDFFKNTRLDLATMSTGVREFLAANFNTLELTPAGYTEEELAELGIADLPCVEGKSFVVDDKKFILLDSTKEINGEKYLGVLSTVIHSATWYHLTPYMLTKDGQLDEDNEIDLYLMDDRQYDFTNKTIDLDKVTNIQDYVTEFDVLGDYIIPDDTEWDLHPGSGDVGRVYFKGSVGVPTITEIETAYTNEGLSVGGFEDMLMNMSVGYWAGNFYWKRWKTDGTTSNTNFFINNICTYSGSNGFGGTWYLKTYVKEDFFKNTRLDLATMSTGVREYLADNYYIRDFASGLYDEYEFAAIGVRAQPDEDEYIIEWSPDYVKLEDGTELLYNGETDGDYISFTLAKDLAGKSKNSGHVGVHQSKQPTGPNGEDLTDYGAYYLIAIDSTNKSSGITVSDATMEVLPEQMVELIPVREYTVGSGYFSGCSNVKMIPKSLVKANLPTGTIMERHGMYLADQILDNTAECEGSQKYENGSKVAIVSDAVLYSQNAYDPTVPGIIGTGVNTHHVAGSVFPVFYVHKDFLTKIKVDVKTLGENVKPMFAENFTKGDFTADYTDEEFKALGVKAFNEIAKDITKFTVGNETYIITGDKVVEDGVTYYAVLNTSSYYSQEGNYGNISLTLDEETSTDSVKYYNAMTYKSQYGAIKRKGESIGSISMDFTTTALETTFPTAVFGENLKEHNWELSSSWLWDDANVSLYFNGKIFMPSAAELKAIVSKAALDFGEKGVWALTRTFDYYKPDKWAHMHVVSNTGSEKDGHSLVSNKELSWRGDATQGSLFVMAYVNEAWFKSAGVTNPFAGYVGEGLGLEVKKTSEDAEVFVHNNGNEAAGKGSLIVVASYNGDVMVDVKTLVVEENVSANSMTMAFNVDVDVTDATSVKAMLWAGSANFKPVSCVASAN